MEFLQNVLGEGYEEFCEKLNSYNLENPDNAIQLANLAEGSYLSREMASELEEQNRLLSEQLKNQDEFPDKKQLEEEKEALEAELSKVKFDNVVEIALIRAGAKNTKAVSALLELDTTDIDEVIDKIEAVKASNPFLFDNTHTATGMPQGSHKSSASAAEEIRNSLFGKK